jgi:alkylhydroperoxidase/carboxymuconolactone decarboxylase family protein YurZ
MENNSPPLKPMALSSFKSIDSALGKITGNFWKLVWGNKKPAINQKTKYLLSLANAVGARRFRQATRELIKGYVIGVTVNEMDELFILFVWNQGIGHFASEIVTSPLFIVYQLIKSEEAKGIPKKEIIHKLMEKFGEDNPDITTKLQSFDDIE